MDWTWDRYSDMRAERGTVGADRDELGWNGMQEWYGDTDKEQMCQLELEVLESQIHHHLYSVKSYPTPLSVLTPSLSLLLAHFQCPLAPWRCLLAHTCESRSNARSDLSLSPVLEFVVLAASSLRPQSAGALRGARGTAARHACRGG